MVRRCHNTLTSHCSSTIRALASDPGPVHGPCLHYLAAERNEDQGHLFLQALEPFKATSKNGISSFPVAHRLIFLLKIRPCEKRISWKFSRQILDGMSTIEYFYFYDPCPKYKKIAFALGKGVILPLASWHCGKGKCIIMSEQNVIPLPLCLSPCAKKPWNEWRRDPLTPQQILYKAANFWLPLVREGLSTFRVWF